MKKYHDIVLDNSGNAVLSATITVSDVGGGVSSIYSDNVGTVQANPFAASSIDGAYSFYAANGRYDINIVATGFVTENLTDVVLFDKDEVYTDFESTGIDDNADAKCITFDVNEDTQFVGTAQFAAGEGIVFNGDTIAAANTLDDYEEGIWTPALSDGTNNATSAIAVGSYEIIGRQVSIKGFLTTSSLGSVSGGVQINGLPFTPSADTSSNTSVSVGYGVGLAITAGYSMGGFMGPSAASIFLRLWDVATGQSAMQHTEWSPDGGIMFSATYYV